MPASRAVAGRLEMPIVRRGDANDIHATGEHIADGIGSRENFGRERSSLAIAYDIASAALPGQARDGGQMDFDKPEVATKEAGAVELLEQRPIGLVEDHPQADHAGTNHGGNQSLTLR